MKKIALKPLSVKERASSFQEVKLLQALRHPYICSYYESFTHKPTNTLCIVMTYCAGGDIHSRLRVCPCPSAFKQDCYCQYCILYGKNKGGHWGVLYLPIVVQ